MQLTASLRATSRGSLLQVVKTSVAAIVAWFVCTAALGQPLPIFAAIAALLVVQPSVNQSLAKGLERSVGVILGVLLASAAQGFFGHSSLTVLGIIVVALLLAWMLRLSPGSAIQIPISAMLVIAVGATTPGYAVNRVIETIIGAVVGLVINTLIVPPVLVGPAGAAVRDLATSVADTLGSVAAALRSPQSGEQLSDLISRARALKGLRDAAAAALRQADESLMLNPRRGQHRQSLEHNHRLLASLTVLVTRVSGMARALSDNYDAGLTTDPFVASIAVELDRAAHDLILLIDERDGRAARGTVEPPALTSPLVIAKPDPRNWILIGSLLEDLRRVREEILGGSV
jgi:uncharacterized membrane protein YgaE (UPF0421/DUF939 family)